VVYYDQYLSDHFILNNVFKYQLLKSYLVMIWLILGSLASAQNNPITTIGPTDFGYDLENHLKGSALSAKVDINEENNSPAIRGTLSISQMVGNQANLFLEMSGFAPDSLYGWHIHEGKSISPNCTAAGAHFNPYNVLHKCLILGKPWW
jgi:Cu/Zn superoxide dismutase